MIMIRPMGRSTVLETVLLMTAASSPPLPLLNYIVSIYHIILYFIYYAHV